MGQESLIMKTQLRMNRSLFINWGTNAAFLSGFQTCLLKGFMEIMVRVFEIYKFYKWSLGRNGFFFLFIMPRN